MTHMQAIVEVGGLWKNMTPDAKKPYDALAASDKARYHKMVQDLETQGFFTNSKGEKCQGAPRNMSPEKPRNVPEDQLLNYSLKSHLNIKELRSKYPDLVVKQRKHQSEVSSEEAPMLKCEVPATKKPKGPKKPATGYMFFMKEKSPVVMKQKSLSMIEASKLIGQMWRELKNKKKYEALHLTDVQRYEAEMA
jgi:hypothetical protein